MTPPNSLSFICFVSWYKEISLITQSPDYISERVYAIHVASRWWYFVL